MTDDAKFYEWHPGSKSFRLFMSAAFAVASVWVAWHASTPILTAVAIAFAFGALATQFEQRVCLDFILGTVTRQITLWGFCLWSTRARLDEFVSIGAYRAPCTNSGSRSDFVHVGLRRAAGGIFAVRYFVAKRDQPCPEAELFARELEQTTRLKFQGAA